MRRHVRHVMLAFIAGVLMGAIVVAELRSASRSGQVIPAPTFSPIQVPIPVGATPGSEGQTTGRPDPAPTRTPGTSPAPDPPVPPEPTRTRPAATERPATAKPSRVIAAGAVTWYATGRDGLYGAAGPALRRALGRGYLGERVTVNWRGRSVRVTIITSCWCRDRNGQPTVIDLSDEAIARLTGDWRSRGVLYDAEIRR